MRAEARTQEAAQAFLNNASAAAVDVPAHERVTLYPAVPMSVQRVANVERAQMLVESLHHPQQEGAPHAALSERELQTLQKIASGKKLSDIAEELMLSPKTVSVYRARVLEKLHLANNAELTVYAIRNGIV